MAHDAPLFLAPEFFDHARRLAQRCPWSPRRGLARCAEFCSVVRVGRDLHALRSDQTPGFDYVGDVDALGALFRALETDPGWDVLRLKNVPEASPLATRLPDVVRAAGGRAIVRPGARHYVRPRVVRGEPRAQVPHQPRCRERKLGGVSFERLTHPTRADFVEAFGIEAMAWKAAAGTAMAIDERVSHLYEIVIRLFGAAGHASLSFIRADGRRVVRRSRRTPPHLLRAQDRVRPAARRQRASSPRMFSSGLYVAARGLARFDFVGREDA
ncbi:MAG: hypothetical protein U0235_05430 [Polyangiaceae bacterium]